jgi:hypothetical protein
MMEALLFLWLFARARGGKDHGPEVAASRRSKGGVTLRAYKDRFVRLTSTKTDFYLPPGKRTAADAVEIARGTPAEIATVIKFAAENFE